MFKDNINLKKENASLRQQQAELSKALTQLEQYSRINNVEIRGVPVTKAEDCELIMKAIAAKVDCDVAIADINSCHRVPLAKSATDKNIVVRLVSRNKRNDFVKKARKARFTTLDFEIKTGAPIKIYINDHLCPEYKKLFSAALRLKREKGWNYVWTDQGTIKVRKTDASAVYKITSASDLSIFN